MRKKNGFCFGVLFLLGGVVGNAQVPERENLTIEVPPKKVLLGILDYAGGEQTHSFLDLHHKEKFSYIEVAIPRHCPAIKVSEVATFAEGIGIKAIPFDSDPHLFRIKFGPTRIEGVVVDLEGPNKSFCAVPVYGLERVSKVGGEPDPDLAPALVSNPKLKLCNSYHRSLEVTVLYEIKQSRVLEGLIRLAPGQCINPRTRGPLRGYIYLHAEATDGAVWSGRTRSCRPVESSFFVEEFDCYRREHTNEQFFPIRAPREGENNLRFTFEGGRQF